jgi:hypothetical protein
MTLYPKLVRTPEAVKEARNVLGLTVDQLARMLRVDAGRTVRRWEVAGATIPGPVTVVLETAMSYLNERAMIAQQLEWLRSGKMRTGGHNGHQRFDDTEENIVRLVVADAEYDAALKILMRVDERLGNDLDALTLQPTASDRAQEVHWYHLWRQTPKHLAGQKDDWSIPGEVSPEAALVHFEKHEDGFEDGLCLCPDPDDLSVEFILEQREVLRSPRGNSVGLRAGRLVDSFAVRRGRVLSRNAPNPDETLPFKPIRLRRLAPGSNGGSRRLASLQGAISYVNEHVPNSTRSEFSWLVAITALNHSARTGEQFAHARAALAEALRSEGWMDD